MQGRLVVILKSLDSAFGFHFYRDMEAARYRPHEGWNRKGGKLRPEVRVLGIPSHCSGIVPLGLVSMCIQLEKASI